MVLINSTPDGIPDRWYTLPLIDKEWGFPGHEHVTVRFSDGSLGWIIETKYALASAFSGSCFANAFCSFDCNGRECRHQLIEFVIHYPSFVFSHSCVFDLFSLPCRQEIWLKPPKNA
jgi:hypothetical protein